MKTERKAPKITADRRDGFNSIELKHRDEKASISISLKNKEIIERKKPDMQWKDNLCIGVEKIDKQHRELFEKTNELLSELHGKSSNKKEKCINTILFLKGYAVKHFADEEAYQQSIGYKYFDEHKKLHSSFVKAVLDHESKMAASDFSDSEVKSFTGMLVAWLLYHVADADQKIGKDDVISEKFHAHNDIIYFSACDVLNKMAGLDFNKMQWLEEAETLEDSHAFKVAFNGDINGYISFVYSVAFIMNLMEALLSYKPEGIGELEISAMYEVSNIITGTICRLISEDKNLFCDLSTPLMINKADIVTDEKIYIDTGAGVFEVGIYIEKQ